MELDIINLGGEKIRKEKFDFLDAEVRLDVIKRVVDWQLARRRGGCHKTKTVSEVSGTTKKPFAQKGRGAARHGSLRSVQMRGGGTVHGPVVRGHDTDLPKKIRKLGLLYALAYKAQSNKLGVYSGFDLDNHKTKNLVESISKTFPSSDAFVVSDKSKYKNFSLASRNIPLLKFSSIEGINVYDILKHDYFAISIDCLNKIQEAL